MIEHLSGQSYERFVIDMLAPAGVKTMAIGGTTFKERMQGEVRYYSPPGIELRPNVFPGGGFVPLGSARNICARWTPTEAGSPGRRTR